MAIKPTLWLIDTSVFLNVLDVPQFNQDRQNVLSAFEERIQDGDSFLLPFTSILETGNHIAHIKNKDQRQNFARKFSNQVIQSLNGNTPWKPLAFPEPDQIAIWLSDFPDSAQAQVGLGDHVIIKQWEEQCKIFGGYTVKIWSLDDHLKGYECNH